MELPEIIVTREDAARAYAIAQRIPGYSGTAHYGFFKWAITANPDLLDILILGVYFGRDIAFMLDVIRHYCPDRAITITAVDKFRDTPCTDWGAAAQEAQLSWKDAGFGMAPSMDAAMACIIPHLSEHTTVDIICEEHAAYLAATPIVFDLIYQDGAHDYPSVSAQHRAFTRLCRSPETLVCGDDYSDAGTWGVKRAVSESFKEVMLFDKWIWCGRSGDMRDQAHAAQPQSTTAGQ